VAIASVVFSPDSQTLVTAAEDARVILWNLDRIRQLIPLQYGCDWVRDYLQHSLEVKRRDRSLCN
jgi:WD40 repeat protein